MHEKKTHIFRFAKTLLDPITFNITLRYVSFVIRISSAKKINTAFLTFMVHGKANVFFVYFNKTKIDEKFTCQLAIVATSTETTTLVFFLIYRLSMRHCRCCCGQPPVRTRISQKSKGCRIWCHPTVKQENSHLRPAFNSISSYFFPWVHSRAKTLPPIGGMIQLTLSQSYILIRRSRGCPFLHILLCVCVCVLTFL